MSLIQMHYDANGELVYPRRHDRAPESALADYLAQAADLLAGLPDPVTAPSAAVDDTGLVTQDFEHLRWFDIASS
jgi:hypothetical protein